MIGILIQILFGLGIIGGLLLFVLAKYELSFMRGASSSFKGVSPKTPCRVIIIFKDGEKSTLVMRLKDAEKIQTQIGSKDPKISNPWINGKTVDNSLVSMNSENIRSLEIVLPESKTENSDPWI